MRIFFERTGGFAGLKIQRRLDSGDLSPGETRRLESLLEKSRLFDLPPRPESPSSGADRFHYKLTVESDRGIRTFEASEASLPDEVRPLIDWLTRFSRR